MVRLFAVLFSLVLASNSDARALAADALARAHDEPELAATGSFAVGTGYSDIAMPGRTIGLRLWYPAKADASGPAAIYRHTLELPGQPPLLVEQPGSAMIGATPAANERYPLILLSHGYGGWSEHMSRLGESLASHGYVVAAIDHRDAPFSDAVSFAASFAAVLLHRSADQQYVLQLLAEGQSIDPAVARIIRTRKIGLIGYSMGGYGALTTAGASVDPDAPALAALPPAARAKFPVPDPSVIPNVAALVAIAPWGAQPGALAWRPESLARVSAPLLVISGDRDDVVDYQRGVRPLFDQLRGSDRYMLVYREAAHNIAGNPVALNSDASFGQIEYLSDAVWRKERLDALNRHFILAFFDLHLKGQEERRVYLDVPTTLSDAGEWPRAEGGVAGANYAGAGQPLYWRGFQRRWARGLEMHHKAVGE